MNIKKAIVSGAAIVGILASVAFPAFAENADNGNMDLVHVGLNPATCGTMPGVDSGTVNVHSNFNQDTFMVNLSVHDALPNTTYEVDIRCGSAIGTLTTNSQGTGTAHIKMSPAMTGTFFIDISVPTSGGGFGDTFIAGPFTLN